jgi:hypothetical protein
MASALGSALATRLEGGIGGGLMMLFIAVSFDLSIFWLVLAAGIGAAAGSVLVLHGAELHPTSPR